MMPELNDKCPKDKIISDLRQEIGDARATLAVNVNRFGSLLGIKLSSEGEGHGLQLANVLEQCFTRIERLEKENADMIAKRVAETKMLYAKIGELATALQEIVKIRAAHFQAAGQPMINDEIFAVCETALSLPDIAATAAKSRTETDRHADNP